MSVAISLLQAEGSGFLEIFSGLGIATQLVEDVADTMKELGAADADSVVALIMHGQTSAASIRLTGRPCSHRRKKLREEEEIRCETVILLQRKYFPSQSSSLTEFVSLLALVGLVGLADALVLGRDHDEVDPRPVDPAPDGLVLLLVLVLLVLQIRFVVMLEKGGFCEIEMNWNP